MLCQPYHQVSGEPEPPLHVEPQTTLSEPQMWNRPQTRGQALGLPPAQFMVGSCGAGGKGRGDVRPAMRGAVTRLQPA